MNESDIEIDDAGFPLLTGREGRRALTREQAKEVAEIESRARRALGPGFWWPYGPNIRVESRIAMLEWVERLGVHQSRTGRLCLHWLAVGRCLHAGCSGVGGKSVDGSYRNWADHVTAWYVPYEDLRLMVAQPYLTPGDVKDLPDGFHVTLSPSGWYGLGTCLVEIWSKDPGNIGG